jgi:hypothetical protein
MSSLGHEDSEEEEDTLSGWMAPPRRRQRNPDKRFHSHWTAGEEALAVGPVNVPSRQTFAETPRERPGLMSRDGIVDPRVVYRSIFNAEQPTVRPRRESTPVENTAEIVSVTAAVEMPPPVSAPDNASETPQKISAVPSPFATELEKEEDAPPPRPKPTLKKPSTEKAQPVYMDPQVPHDPLPFSLLTSVVSPSPCPENGGGERSNS